MNAATARKLAPKIERPQKTKKPRTPLAIVNYVPKKKMLRLPLPILCAVIFIGALFALLAINIAISSSQYRLAELKSMSATLDIENQALTEQIRSYEAPQNLARKASQLGMVKSSSTAVIDVKKLSVTGKAKAAVVEDVAVPVIPSPEINGHYMVPLPETAEPAPVEVAVPAPLEEAVTPAQDDTIDGELNGGTIPAPEQRFPGE